VRGTNEKSELEIQTRIYCGRLSAQGIFLCSHIRSYIEQYTFPLDPNRLQPARCSGASIMGNRVIANPNEWTGRRGVSTIA
jgi:hypothetical protein